MESYELRIKSGIADMETLIGVLVRSGYKVTSRAIMKEFPRETSIEYFSVVID